MIKSFNPHNYPLTCVILLLLPFYSHRNWGLTSRAQSHTTGTQLTQDLKAIQLPALITTLLTTCLQWYVIIVHSPTLPFQAPWNIFILWLYLRNHSMAPYHQLYLLYLRVSTWLLRAATHNVSLTIFIHLTSLHSLPQPHHIYECSLHFGTTHLSDDLLFYPLCLSTSKSLIYSNFLLWYQTPQTTST